MGNGGLLVKRSGFEKSDSHTARWKEWPGLFFGSLVPSSQSVAKNGREPLSSMQMGTPSLSEGPSEGVHDPSHSWIQLLLGLRKAS
jgi:hypothetical protein